MGQALGQNFVIFGQPKRHVGIITTPSVKKASNLDVTRDTMREGVISQRSQIDVARSYNDVEAKQQ